MPNDEKELTTAPLPAQSREDRLPCHTIPQDRFENACLDLARIGFHKLRPELKEIRGAKQYEVDVECFGNDGEPKVVIQCKRYGTVQPAEYIGWVKAFVGELGGHWKERKIETYVLAVTVEGNRESIKKKVREAAELLKPYGIQFEPWFNTYLTHLFRQDANLVRHYFNDAWPDVISAKQPVSETSSTRSASVGASASDIIALSEQVDDAVNEALNLLEREARAGKTEKLRAYLAEQRLAKAAWERLHPSSRARMLRRSMLFAVDDGDLAEAQALFEQANNLSAARNKTAEAHLRVLQSGLDAGINVLEGSSGETEKELLAAFFLAAERTEDCQRILSSLPETAERERLAALMHLSLDQRLEAIAHASRAVELKPDSFGTKLAALLAHFQSALIDGVKVEFATAPNPFDSQIVRADDSAREHLNKALQISEQLLMSTGGNIRQELEVWKLALLICHPERRHDVAGYAKSVIEGMGPSPMFIAWALSLGIDLQIGKLRKYLEDEVRQGRGSATNIVVAALLEKDVEGKSEKAVKLIEKYLTRWPEAEAFLEVWRNQLAGDEILIVAVEKQKSDDFDSLVEEALSRDSPQFTLSAANVLKFRRAYTHILQLEQQLQEIGNAPAILALTEAKINCGSPDEATSLLEGNREIFGSNQPPIAMLQLKAAAADQAGKIGATIQALRALEERSPSADTQVQILQRAIVLNDTPTILKYGKKIESHGQVAGFGRLFAADAVGPHDPSLARSLIEKFIAADDVEPAAVPKVLQLANAYGLQGLAESERFTQLFHAALQDGSHIIRFDDVDQLMAHLAQRDTALRELREQWLQGFIPTHRAFGAEVPAFLETYLADSPDVLTQSGVKYPRILEAGGLPIRDIEALVNADEPLLMIDVSALLLMVRFKLLDAVSAVFSCHIPRVCIPLLDYQLEELRLAKPFEDDEIVRRFETAENTLQSLIKETADDGAEVALERPLPQKPASTELEGFVRAIEESGSDRGATLELRRVLGIKSDYQLKRGFDDVIYRLDAGLIFCLVHSGLLDDASQSLSLAIDVDAVGNIEKSCKRYNELKRVEELVREAREYAAKQLSTDNWREWIAGPELEESDPSQGLAMQSLADCVRAQADARKPTIVIADRFVQRHRLPNVLHFSDLVDVLEARLAITALVAARVRDTLLQTGSGFYAISADDLLAALKSAKLAHGAIVETTGIRSMRHHFGQQVRLLKYIDWSEHRVSEGELIGDPKHVLDTAFQLAALLETVWVDDTLEIDRKRAISEWVWCFLRVETLHGNVPELTETERYMHTLTLVFIKLVMWPLLHQVTMNNQNEWQLYAPYLDWLFTTVLIPRFRAAPEIANRFVDEYARLAIKHGEVLSEDLAESDRQQMSAYVAKQQRALLELFPEETRNRLIDIPEFSELAGYSRNFTVTLGDQHVPVNALSKAIGEAASSSEKSACIEGVDGVLTVDEAESPPTCEVVLEGTDNKVSLAPDTVALLHPDRAMRIECFEAIADRLTTTDAVKPEFQKAHAAEVSANERVKLFNAARKRDFAYAEELLRDLVTQRGDLTDACFQLPTPRALATYLHIDLSSTGSVTTTLSNGYVRLVDNLGLEVADRRYAACPIDFERSEHFEETVPSTGDSMFLFADALRKATQLDSVAIDNMQTQWERLGEVFGWQKEMFTFLVCQGAEHAALASDWSEIKEDIVLALLWVWADRVCAAFIRQEVKLAPILETLKARSHRSIATVLDGRGKPTVLSYFAHHLVEERVALVILARVKTGFKFLTDEQRQLARNWIGIGSDDDREWTVHPSLLFDEPQTFSPDVDSLELGSPEFIGLVPNPDQWDGFNRPDLIEDSLKKIEEASDLNSLTLIVVARPALLDQAQQHRLWSRLKALIEQPEFDFSKEAHDVWLRQFAQLSAHMARKNEFSGTLKGIVQSVAETSATAIDLLEPEPELGSAARTYGTVIESLGAFVAEWDTPKAEKAALLFDELVQISDAWPVANYACHRLMSNLLSQMPTSLSEVCWPVFEALRARD